VQGAFQTKKALHFSFVRRNQTTFRTSNARTSLCPHPAAPIPLHPPSPLPNIPQNSSRPRASAASLFYTDQMNRVHSSEEAPRSFTIPPCVVVERLEGKQRYSRAAVREHSGIQAREWSKWLFPRNEGAMKDNQPPQAAHHANHDSAASRQDLLLCTGAEPIHQVHGQPMSRAPESMLRNRITFPPFSRRFPVWLAHRKNGEKQEQILSGTWLEGAEVGFVRDKGLAHTRRHPKKWKRQHTEISNLSRFEQVELPAKLPNTFLLSNKSNVNRCWGAV